MTRDEVLGFSVGIGVGVGLGLLFAPRAGEETQAMIAKKSREGREFLREQATRLRNSADDLIEKGKQEANRHRRGLEDAIEAGKRAYQQSMG